MDFQNDKLQLCLGANILWISGSIIESLKVCLGKIIVAECNHLVDFRIESLKLCMGKNTSWIAKIIR